MSISQRGTRWIAQGTLLAPAAFLYFVDLFLPWSRVCTQMRDYLLVPPSPFSPSQAHAFAFICQPQTGGWGGAGTVAGVLAGLLFLWEATRVARLDLGVGFGYRSLISAALAFGIIVFTAVDVAARLTWGAQLGGALVNGGVFLWIAVVLAVLVGLSGLAHWRIWDQNGPPRDLT
jgi:hypothetical protein